MQNLGRWLLRMLSGKYIALVGKIPFLLLEGWFFWMKLICRVNSGFSKGKNQHPQLSGPSDGPASNNLNSCFHFCRTVCANDDGLNVVWDQVWAASVECRPIEGSTCGVKAVPDLPQGTPQHYHQILVCF